MKRRSGSAVAGCVGDVETPGRKKYPFVEYSVAGQDMSLARSAGSDLIETKSFTGFEHAGTRRGSPAILRGHTSPGLQSQLHLSAS